MKRTWIATLWILLLAGAVTAQDKQEKLEKNDEQTLIQTSVIWGLPQGALTDNIQREPLGVNILFGGRAPGLPLYLGMDLSFMNHGIQQRVDLQRLEDVPVQAVTSTVRHNIFMVHLLARLQPDLDVVQPYLDLLGGMKTFTTRINVNGDVVIFQEGFHTSERIFDRALSYGIGAGVNLPLYTGKFGIEQRTGTASLTLSARYLFGTDADIAGEGAFDEQAGLFRYETVRSPTEMIIPQFGVRVDL